ncbi:MAG: TatD family hydrolase [Elusimicrobia bacterium]|nr:TatD family hydrolase [Elusimicrobiota bacterium]
MSDFFDTHVHLNDPRFDPDRESVLRLSFERGVRRLVEIADSPAQWDAALALSRSYPQNVRCSLGLHPYHAAEWDVSIEHSLERFAALPEVVAVGEIGLDYAKSPVARNIQKEVFLKMLSSAILHRKPVVIHCRDAYDDMLSILRDAFPRPAAPGAFHGVLHCFLGAPADAARATELGFALGVDGPITYPKNDVLRAAVRAVGLDRLVLETDSPYLPPQSSRGKRNDPGSIPEIARRVGEIFDVTVEEAALRTTQTAARLFRL